MMAISLHSYLKFISIFYQFYWTQFWILAITIWQSSMIWANRCRSYRRRPIFWPLIRLMRASFWHRAKMHFYRHWAPSRVTRQACDRWRIVRRTVSWHWCSHCCDPTRIAHGAKAIGCSSGFGWAMGLRLETLDRRPFGKAAFSKRHKVCLGVVAKMDRTRVCCITLHRLIRRPIFM